MRNISSARAATGKTAPQRTCVACRQVKIKQEMLRLVRTPKGEIEIDTSGRKEGRGAYLCRDWACWEKALKTNQLEHALKGKITRSDLAQLGQAGKEALKELN